MDIYRYINTENKKFITFSVLLILFFMPFAGSVGSSIETDESSSTTMG